MIIPQPQSSPPRTGSAGSPVPIPTRNTLSGLTSDTIYRSSLSRNAHELLRVAPTSLSSTKETNKSHERYNSHASSNTHNTVCTTRRRRMRPSSIRRRDQDGAGRFCGGARGDRCCGQIRCMGRASRLDLFKVSWKIGTREANGTYKSRCGRRSYRGRVPTQTRRIYALEGTRWVARTLCQWRTGVRALVRRARCDVMRWERRTYVVGFERRQL